MVGFGDGVLFVVVFYFGGCVCVVEFGEGFGEGDVIEGFEGDVGVDCFLFEVFEFGG